MSKDAVEALALNAITKRFGELTANDAVSLSVKVGEVVALLGENGAGKTTLMNILFGQYTADSGTVRVFGETLPPGNSRAALDAGVGMVHQHFTLADNLTVQENITLGVHSLLKPGLRRLAAKARIIALSQKFHLFVAPDARVGTLSVGERQRVEILKALYRDVRILILDEPTAVLTPQETDDLFATLRLAIAEGMSIIFISHKLHEVMAIADRVVVLRHGKMAGGVETKDTDKNALAAMMMGTEARPPVVLPSKPGMPLADVEQSHDSQCWQHARFEVSFFGPQSGSDCRPRGRVWQRAGRDGKCRWWAAEPSDGQVDLGSETVHEWTPRIAVQSGIARIPEDRHKAGTIADFDLVENAILERYKSSSFSKGGWLNWREITGLCGRYYREVRCAMPRIGYADPPAVWRKYAKIDPWPCARS